MATVLQRRADAEREGVPTLPQPYLLFLGDTSEAGYGLVGSAIQNGRRIVFVISVLDSDKARAEEAERIVGWAFRQFSEKTVAKAG